VFVPDLGLDQVKIYQLEAAQAELLPHGEGTLPPGAGPRHMVFDLTGRFIYVLNELALSVTVFDYDVANGTMKAVETIPTVSESVRAKETFLSASEIRMHPSGKFVYAANRGHDTITAFRIAESTGRLTEIMCEAIRGSHPRNFNLDPNGRWLLAAGRDTNSISVFAINGETGELTFTHRVVPVPSPICVVFGTVGD
jgi:6-phosphogluconolactonase